LSKIGIRVKQLREEKNLSLRQLSKITDISPSALHSYEVGTREPSYKSLEALSDVFNCDIDYLLGRTSVKNKTASELGYASLSEFYMNSGNKDKKIPPEESTLSEGEKDLLELFRRIPEDQRKLVLQMIQVALGRI
jgi:transcriptional regulator with XRE-family HTH domain